MKRKNAKRKEDASNQLSAIALQYKAEAKSVPKVSAKGKGLVAKEILRIAEEYNIPVKEDTDLIELLGHLELGEEIPPELYRVVAELLAYIYTLNKKALEGK